MPSSFASRDHCSLTLFSQDFLYCRVTKTRITILHLKIFTWHSSLQLKSVCFTSSTTAVLPHFSLLNAKGLPLPTELLYSNKHGTALRQRMSLHITLMTMHYQVQPWQCIYTWGGNESAVLVYDSLPANISNGLQMMIRCYYALGSRWCYKIIISSP